MRPNRCKIERNGTPEFVQTYAVKTHFAPGLQSPCGRFFYPPKRALAALFFYLYYEITWID